MALERGICIALGKAAFATALVFACLAWMSSAAPACACGEFRGSVVAHGLTPSGEPWRIKAARPTTDSAGRRSIELYFSVGLLDGYENVGFFKGMALPIPKRFVLSANAGSDVGGDNDLSAVVGRRAVTLVIGLSTGEQLRVAPQLAPERLRRRSPWLRGLRFFDEFFSRNARPLWVRAINHRGRPLGSARSDRGLFWIFKKGEAPGASLWGRKFEAISVRRSDGKRWPASRAREVHVSFWRQQQKQWIGWSAACNIFHSRVRINSSSIERIGRIKGTAKGCPAALEREDAWLTQFFRSDLKWHWHSGRLVLRSHGSVIKLKREP